MLAVSFLFPTVVAAGAAAVAPVIIHLIMRTKPRKLVFPAMRFVRKTHQANLSKLRLKHLLLLLLRMLAIAGLAVLVARPRLEQWTAVADTNVPTAAVFVVDTSGSMSYEHQGKTLLVRGKRFAQQVLDCLPADSRAAVLSTQQAVERPSFQADRKLVAEQLASVEATCGTRPLGPALLRAVAMLKKVDLERKEVYVVSDMTARSWRDLTRIDTKGIRFIVLNCSAGEDANIALGEIRLDSTSVPEGAEVTVETLLRSAQVGGEIGVRVELDGKSVESQSVMLRPGSAAAVTLKLTPRQRGVLHGRIFFEQADPLAMDNVRYFTLHVGPPVRLLIVRDPATIGRGAPTSFLMAHAVAPGASGGLTSWVRRDTITADRLDAAQLSAARVVLLCDVSGLSEAQWTALEKYVRDGGHVWAVIGSLISAASYNAPAAQRILPAAHGELELLAQRVGWKPPRQGEPMLAPFASDANPPLSEVRCERRLRLTSLASDTHVALSYADDKPAILTRTVGRGSVVLWNFSPAREFSNLAGLAQFPILAQRTVRLLAGGAEERTLWQWGQSATVAVPKNMESAMITVRRPHSAVEEPVVRSLRERVVAVQAGELGHWGVQFSEGESRIRRGFSVNADFAESDLTGAEPEQLHEIIPPEQLLIASSTEDLAEGQRTVTQPLDLAVPLLLGLLALMMGESFFANRFYRQDEGHSDLG